MATPTQRPQRRRASPCPRLAGALLLSTVTACGLTQQPSPPAAEIAGIAADTDRGWTSPLPPPPAANAHGQVDAIAALHDDSPVPEPSDDPAIALVHRALVHLLLDDAAALDADHARVLALDRERVQRGEPKTDLADHVRYLRASLAPDREGYLAALTAARKNDADPLLRRHIAWRIETDQVVAAQRLLSDSRYNRGA